MERQRSGQDAGDMPTQGVSRETLCVAFAVRPADVLL
jgi:hypothetical protein